MISFKYWPIINPKIYKENLFYKEKTIHKISSHNNKIGDVKINDLKIC